MSEQKIKFGLVGIGNIGNTHLKYLSEMDNVALVGVCDVDKEKADLNAKTYGTTAYYDVLDLLDNSGLDVIIIAVPHYDHPYIAIEAFKRGIHVMCEKPIAVHVNDANRMIDAYESAKETYPGLQFAIMFQERTLPFYAKLKEIVASGELGQLTRATWIHTKWFRSQSYYNSGGWRATWAGEGGGILTNQCPHTLDMYQWLFGLPSLISGHAHIGKYHDIEVEDEVTAYFEHSNGMIGHLIVTTAELPGTNRLEIVGDTGKLVLENGKLLHYKYEQSMLTFTRETEQKFATWQIEPEEVEVDENAPNGHHVVTGRLVDRLLGKEIDLIAEGPEGLGSLTLANGIMLSSFQKRPVEVPIDGDAFQSHLDELIKSSTFVKKVVTESKTQEDMSASFGSSK
ncbi:Gfo/Idh/MocA family oxidoreductase [Paenibacillus chondroitinus]|uniref:Gfo/Idh/MocA family oxidoreductase n=1 Tax=Paenibacillus chondroitinus TaxID=59842 RepID=A0ABU6D7C6_9BACL|nr:MULTISPECIES: Gfo/Idh/MocA family oxidoreductase [Paenibacillus]MCY9658848.1 Gfo/Idh/MocA family oxidoreductase [Paenibacillus anseongense]MEB4792846.1 Gfo/Idh/MocA family oxidoreductase [Paenibacillus chondroitinus]